jgi:hypothetical protein
LGGNSSSLVGKTWLLKQLFPNASYHLKSDLAAPLGLNVPGVGRWLDILEATAQILLVPPYLENLGKRIIKSPKVHIADSGLACHLLGIDTDAELEKSPFLGALFEGFIASEIAKAQVNGGHRRQLFYFRDQQGLEVDFLVPGRGASVSLIEAKSTRTVTLGMAVPTQRLAMAWTKRPGLERKVRSWLVHRPARKPTGSRAIAPGVEARPWQDFLQEILRAV